MSAGGQTTGNRDIPAVRRVTIHDAAHMPEDYSTTPGGTLFSTTPGGTRIIYDRKFLLQCRTSPLARTPPNLPDIPGVTRPLKPNSCNDSSQPEPTPGDTAQLHRLNEENAADAQFEMDI
ncbi:eukaryotic translation initiation factor 4E-binding protein 1-like isoform X1 [Pseudoliparis swirei]|uniref:eukaryotic translation initiation factor 4E-binding protein 1-like isoform X1 n=1 Tax=Pseudoliparis swirei TaxID=2059687 RepID=UPI0024BE9619|nr:eukaryotic translation initiation factor 4E-binding protein 1-like isoform X1 [Pseudoliparis swirei]